MDSHFLHCQILCSLHYYVLVQRYVTHCLCSLFVYVKFGASQTKEPHQPQLPKKQLFYYSSIDCIKTHLFCYIVRDTFRGAIRSELRLTVLPDLPDCNKHKQ